MKRGSTNQFSCWTTGLAVVVGIVWNHALSPVMAAPPPPPTGVIYFYSGPGAGSIDSIRPDGSGRTSALPAAALNNLNPGYAGRAVPSGLTSGGRWFITTAETGEYEDGSPHHDLVAVRSNGSQLDVVPLTDLYGIFDFTPGFAFWSNDSNEDPAFSFAAGWGTDLRDGTGATMRLPVTVSEIEAGELPPVDDTLTDEEIDDLLWPSMLGVRFPFQGANSPDGGLSLCVDARNGGAKLLILEAATANRDSPVLLLWNGSSTPPRPHSPQWSPNGQTVAFASQTGDIWTVPSSGATPPTKILSGYVTNKKGGSITSRYTYPVWSPDSNYLAVIRDDTSSSSVTGSYIVRVRATGGTATQLGGALPSTSNGGPIRWVAN